VKQKMLCAVTLLIAGTIVMAAAPLRLRSAPSPRSEARGHFAADVASGVAAQV